jgi:hypothetical protein
MTMGGFAMRLRDRFRCNRPSWITTVYGLAFGALFLLPAGARAGVYWIDETDQYYEKSSWWSDADGSRVGDSCLDTYDDGVVRSWYLKERNVRDYRKSYHFCRDMRTDGTLGSDYAREEHFWYSGSSTSGNSSIPTDKLPVGVRLTWDFISVGTYVASDWKLEDVELHFDDANDILDGRTNHDRAGAAFGHDGSQRDLDCDPGYVMTGLWVKARHESARNQAEIRAVRIECSGLYYRPTATATYD